MNINKLKRIEKICESCKQIYIIFPELNEEDIGICGECE